MYQKYSPILIYLFILLIANPIPSLGYDSEALINLREGTLKRLIIHKETLATTSESFQDLEQNDVSLEDFKGKVVVLNFWATWCAPCRKEMPTLDNLQRISKDKEIEVVVVHVGPNRGGEIEKFFEKENIKNITSYVDPNLVFAGSMNAFGLPTTIILDKHSQEVGRLIGDEEWDQEAVIVILDKVSSFN